MYVPFRTAQNGRTARKESTQKNDMEKCMFCPLMRWWTTAEFNNVDYRRKNRLKFSHLVESVHKSPHQI